ncbi:MAG: hypothetical protein CMM02_03780 [Rhodopirellula sp.]|nr:hypothetical protein [Rhodopirellula sp.]|tara:strand:- start:5753 stop:6586 length:834 start_codon:yes stop_codon:yes gene_type:complete
MYSNSYNFNNNFDKIIVIGDIHGDLKRLKHILVNDNIINKDLEWIANNVIIIQVGDQIDSLNRNDNIEEWEILKDIEVLNFTNLLSKLALENNSLFISLNGNHELMNILGNFSYVSKNSLYENRLNNFKFKGIYNDIIGNRPIVIKVNDLIFCHAGVKKLHLDILDKYNKDIFYLNTIWKKFVLLNKVDINDKEIFDKIILNDEGILWTRNEDSPDDINYVLNKLNSTFIFIGHNTVPNIFLNNNIWYVDNSISRSYGKNNYEYIRIQNKNITIVKI